MKRCVRPLIWVTVSVLVIAGMMAALVALMEHKSSRLPAVSFQTLTGETVGLEQVAAGKPMLVNLWATWCAPCIREMPLLQAYQDAHPDVRFVFVNQGEHTETVRSFLSNHELSLEHVILDSKGQLAQVTASMALPTTLLYSAKGEQVGLYRSELSDEQLTAMMQTLRQGAAHP